MNDTLITRVDYSKSNTTSSSSIHRAYYAQFVVPAHFARIRNLAGLVERIESSQDLHFNNIQLSTWDIMAVPVPAEAASKMCECGDYPTLAGAVCILKEAAQQIREQRINTRSTQQQIK